MKNGPQKNDSFFSVCIIDDHNSEKELKNSVQLISTSFENTYKFWEIILVSSVDNKKRNTIDSILINSKNIRYIGVKDNLSHYQKRVIASQEAIGDYILLTSPDEIEEINFIEMLESSFLESKIVIANYNRSSRFLNWITSILGSMAGYRVSDQTARTIVFPRTNLNYILEHYDNYIGLRYLNFNDFQDAIIYEINFKNSKRNFLYSLSQKFDLAWRLIVLSAPKILFIIAFLSILAIFLGLFSVFYVFLVLVFLTDIQPGWATTTLLISSLVILLGGVLFGISLGIQRLIDLLSKDDRNSIIQERDANNLFSIEEKKFNVTSNDENSKN